MTDLDDTAYELLAVPASAEEAALRRIGRYPTYNDALRARDEDVLDELAARGGWYTVIEHVIVGPGLAGPANCAPARNRARAGSGGREAPKSRRPR